MEFICLGVAYGFRNFSCIRANAIDVISIKDANVVDELVLKDMGHEDTKGFVVIVVSGSNFKFESNYMKRDKALDIAIEIQGIVFGK